MTKEKEKDKDVRSVMYFHAEGLILAAYEVRNPSTWKYSTPQWHMTYGKVMMCCTHEEALEISELFKAFRALDIDESLTSKKVEGLQVIRYHFDHEVEGVVTKVPHYHISRGDRILGYMGNGSLKLFCLMVDRYEENQLG